MQPQLNWSRISSTGAPSDEGWLGNAWDTVTDGVEGIVNGVTTLANGVIDTVGGLLGPAIDFFGAIVRKVLFSIPFIGGVFSAIWGGILGIIAFFASIFEFVLAFLGILPEKRMKLLVIIQLDETGTPTTTVAEALPIVQAAIDTFKNQANVRILPVGYFTYATAFQDSPTVSGSYFTTETEPSTSETLDVCCDSCALGNHLTATGPMFQDKMLQDCPQGNVSSLIGYSAPVCAFAVRSFTEIDPITKKQKYVGCSLGPLTDYVTMDFTDAASGAAGGGPDALGDKLDLAHELGHACNLTHGAHVLDHRADGNLMNPEPANRGPSLTTLQVATLRTSRHVTYLDLPF